ncbi:MAG: four helix bundle protein [Saprospiraceae bacterium]|nr:four helix bundle protein [Saprospiraceae bacterium]
MYQYSFEKLDVWKRAILLSKEIYLQTKKFPETEKFSLISQIRRASVSVTANIAEGSARSTAREKQRFYQIAYGSLMEVLNFLILSRELKYLSEEDYLMDRSLVNEVANKLNALSKSEDRKRSQ